MLSMTKSRVCWLTLAGGVAAISLGCWASRALAGGFFNNRSVGGVAVTTEGVLEAPTVQDERELAHLRQNTPLAVPAALEEFTELRAVSLKQIEAAVAKARADMKPIPEEVTYLAGLQRVRYVFVYPERKDIVLVGPAEGWKMDALGNIVGLTTNRPVLMIDDLMVALRSGKASRVGAITCSIDPTPDGLARLQALTDQLTSIGNPDQTLAAIEEALGPQVVSVTGVPTTSHFARTMVAADFRMKRLAMNFEPAPVKGMPSYLSMVSGRGRGTQNMMPRWWLAPNYEPLAKTEDGLAWELRGPGVKCLTEEDYVSASGQKERTGQASGPAVKWANTMTEKFDELAEHDSSFGQLRNIMDLAVIGALIEKEQLAEIAGLEMPRLMGGEALDLYPTPTRTSSKASVLRKGRNWIISASGGVEMLPWNVAEQTETVAAVGETRSEMESEGEEFWWE
jgi:hypothetical protein